MRESAAPVFVFLPVERTTRSHAAPVVDPVCGRALVEREITGHLRHGGRHHYFCSIECAERFAVSVREPETE